jgi:hypothetical protein
MRQTRWVCKQNRGRQFRLRSIPSRRHAVRLRTHKPRARTGQRTSRKPMAAEKDVITMHTPQHHHDYRDRTEYEGLDDDAREGVLETVDNLVERLANGMVEETQKLAKATVAQALHIEERHKLVRRLQVLEPKATVSLKSLRERLNILQQISNFPLQHESDDKLKARLDILKAIDDLDIADDVMSMKELRARLRILEKIVGKAAEVAALPPTPEAIRAKAEADLVAAKAARALAKANRTRTNVVTLVTKAPTPVEDEDGEDREIVLNG